MKILRKLDKKEELNLPKRIILTHLDADGLTSAVTIQKYIEKFENDRYGWFVVASISPTSDETDKMLTEVIGTVNLGFQDKIYIVDRGCLTSEYLKRNLNKLNNSQIIYIDHHLTNNPELWLSNREQFKNLEIVWNDKESGASLTYNYFKEMYNKDIEGLKELSEKVKLWDIFEWTKLDKERDREKYIGALQINALEKMFGTSFFYKKVMEYCEDIEKLDNIFSLAYEIYNENFQEYLPRVERKYIDFKIDGNYVKLYYDFDYRYQSLFSYETFKKDEADILIYLSPQGTLSLRSKEEVDISELANKLGKISGFSGGGHKNASGCRVVSDRYIKDMIVDKLKDSIERLCSEENRDFQYYY